MNMENSISQTEELLALQSIYEEKDLIVEQENPPCGRFIVNVQLPKQFSIVCKKNPDVVQFEVDYLPPINLFFEFPPTYPSESCPAFLLSCNWLNRDKLSVLCRKLESIWSESYGEVILFSWISFLQEETLRYLDIVDSLDVTELFRPLPSKCENNTSCAESDFHKLSISTKRACVEVGDENGEPDCCMQMANIKPSVTGGSSHIDCRAVSDFISGPALLSVLKEYDSNKKHEMFQSTWVVCQICYVSKKGTDFQQFNKCKHNYCCDCLRSYFEIQIKDGNVHSLNCPEEGCSSQADSTLVKSLVCSELFEKYDGLLLSRSLEGMPDIAYCPRRPCQTPLLIDPGSRIGCCPLCSFAFCVFCRKAYHGIAPCNFKTEEKKELCKKYLESTSDGRIELERRYGRREMKFLVENVKSEEWVESNSKPCPHCHSNIEKTDGCNKMTCYRCGKYFCWLCATLLKASNPYSHFSDVTSRCYNQLFPENYEFVMPGEYLDL